jgi:hypothetical protein
LMLPSAVGMSMRNGAVAWVWRSWPVARPRTTHDNAPIGRVGRSGAEPARAAIAPARFTTPARSCPATSL